MTPFPRVPWGSEGGLASLWLSPPLLGQHSAELLAERAYDAPEVVRLAGAGVVTLWEGAPATAQA